MFVRFEAGELEGEELSLGYPAVLVGQGPEITGFN